MTVLDERTREISHIPFESALRAMSAHQKACSDVALFVSATDIDTIGRHVMTPPPYPLHSSPLFGAPAAPLPPEFYTAADGQGSAKSDMKDLSNSLKEELQGIQRRAGEEAKQLASQVQQDKNVGSFKQQMEELKRTTKQHVDSLIDKTFNTAENIGQRFPEAQDFILGVAQKVESFVSGLLTTVINFITNLINNIATWISDVLEKAKGFFQHVHDTIGHFFSSLF